MNRYAADDDPEDMNMFGDSSWMEPDIDGLNANGDPVEYDRVSQSWVVSKETERSYQPTEREPKWTFYDDEGLITSEIFQRLLGQALVHKDREINALRNELLWYLQV